MKYLSFIFNYHNYGKLRKKERSHKIDTSIGASELKKTYDCLALIMETQLRELCLNSMEDYINYLMDVGVSN